MSDRIYLASPNMSGEEMKYIKKAFDTNWIAPLGENVNDFENAFGDIRNPHGSESCRRHRG